MKKIRVICFIVLLFLCGNNIEAQTPSTEQDIAISAEEFFSVWLVQRDVNKALNFLSPNAILGSCMLPEHLEKKAYISKKELRSAFRLILTDTIRYTNKNRKLNELISSEGTDLFSEETIIPVKHHAEQLFRIFTLKPLENASDVKYVCKFDDRKTFRDKVATPNVHYVVSKLTLKEKTPPIVVITLWVQEKDGWRILTMDLSTNED